ncbi:MAG: hypothetical protein HY856_20055 [Burkholderiales bacterium]|jgi:hypothetical protein|nr:hypothetical protein [Burkholderiales bacterium]
MKSRLPTLMGLWQPVTATLDDWTRAVRRFEPLGITHWPQAECRTEGQGQVVWGVPRGTASIGLCWEWCEVQPGVVVLSNPMGVCSNARLLGPDGEAVAHGRQLLAWNDAIHSLGWQTAVARDLARRRARRSTGVRMPPRDSPGRAALAHGA